MFVYNIRQLKVGKKILLFREFINIIIQIINKCIYFVVMADNGAGSAKRKRKELTKDFKKKLKETMIKHGRKHGSVTQQMEDYMLTLNIYYQKKCLNLKK